MAGQSRLTLALFIIFIIYCLISIPRLTFSQSDSGSQSSASALDAGMGSLYYDYVGYDTPGAGQSCAPCSCLPSSPDDMEVDIFCFAEDVPFWSRNTPMTLNLPGYFKYLSIYQQNVNATMNLLDNAFKLFENEILDKVHFHEVSFGLTEAHTFDEFELKYLLIDTSTLVYGNRSFWSLITAVQAVKNSLIELHVIDVHVGDPKTHGNVVTLPPIAGYKHLTTVEFRQVPITYLHQDTFKDSPSLKYVSFKSCPIFDASSDAFINVPGLSLLQISSSNLTKIPQFLLNENLAGLETLALTDSMIENIDDFSFLETFSTHGIRVLDLRGNHITSVNQSAYLTLNGSSTRNLKALYLWDNPLLCNCHLDAFVEWLQSSSSQIDFSGELILNKDSNVTIVEDIFGTDPHCRHLCSFAEDTVRNIRNPECSNPGDLRGVSLLTLDKPLCQSEPQSYRAEPGVGYNPKSGYIKTPSFQLQRLVMFSLATFAAFAILLGLMYGCIMSVDRMIVYMQYCHPFDVYLSHHEDNIQLVMEKCIPRLEQEPNNLKLRFNFDIFQDNYRDNVSESLSKSRVTIFLFDNAFLNSDKCMVDLYQACLHISDDNRNERLKQKGLIIIFLDKIPDAILKDHLKPLRHKITYLHWERKDTKEDEETFCNNDNQWKQLDAALRKLGCKPREVQHLKYQPKDVCMFGDIENPTIPILLLPKAGAESTPSSGIGSTSSDVSTFLQTPNGSTTNLSDDETSPHPAVFPVNLLDQASQPSAVSTPRSTPNLSDQRSQLPITEL